MMPRKKEPQAESQSETQEEQNLPDENDSQQGNN